MASETNRFLANAELYAESFDSGELPAPPASRVVVLTCMDARIDVYALLGLRKGDAHVLRNAGGVVTDDTIRSLSISQHLLGTESVVVIHHTNCGLLGLDEEGFSEHLEQHAGERPPWRAQAFSDLESEVRASIERIAGSVFLPRTDDVRGFVYE